MRMNTRSVSDTVLRYDRLEKSAEARFNRAMADSNTHTARRAAQLWQATAARFSAVVCATVSPYSDRD